MVKRNPNIAKLQAGYLFPEINKRKNALLQRQPDAKLISLGIGDTTLPIPNHISHHLQQYSLKLATPQGYSGYGPEQGQRPLREKIAEVLYHGNVTTEEVFVSDGAKCDIGRLQLLFGASATIAVQDPAYPVYVDTSVMMGQTGAYNSSQTSYSGIVYMPCNPENNFFPDLNRVPRTDLIYFCSPNNPTGAVATRKQLTQLVAFAKANRSILIFDSAYSCFIQDPDLPRSIFEIPGAREVAIEVSSFSKMAGFTGLRLGWTVIPNELLFEDGTPVRKDWERIHTTFFNGASNVVQAGGLAALDPEGLQAIQTMTHAYMENARYITQNLQKMGIKTYGGSNAPYVWAYFGQRNSWEIFEDILENTHVVTTPGSGFGAAGDGFLRLSAFAQPTHIEEAMARLSQYFAGECFTKKFGTRYNDTASVCLSLN
ncbi:MAG: LL-diaminopimelate aminotransferase [Parachlamydiaceae bacterium]|nr:LL-diaminopimelate aminotransferase [Parachlamydiaceae bacterium]